VRAAERPLDDAGFAGATYVRDVEARADAGGPERFVLTGLPPGRRLWVALTAVDAGGSRSGLSNVTSARTGLGGPLRGRSGAALAVLHQPSRVPVSLYWQTDEAEERVPHTIELFDLGGRCVRRFAVGPAVGGVVAWDGRDERGGRLGAGLYFARMADRGPGTRARIMLLP
jgi:hypothetical protein